MTDDRIEVAQSAPRPKQTRPKPERPEGNGTREPEGKRPRPKQLPPTRDDHLGPAPGSIGAGMGLGSLDMREVDQNSIELASAPNAIPKGPNQIT